MKNPGRVDLPGRVKDSKSATGPRGADQLSIINVKVLIMDQWLPKVGSRRDVPRENEVPLLSRKLSGPHLELSVSA